MNWINIFNLVIVFLLILPSFLSTPIHNYLTQLSTSQHSLRLIFRILLPVSTFLCCFFMIFNIGLDEFGFFSLEAFGIWCWTVLITLPVYLCLLLCPRFSKKKFIRLTVAIPALIFFLTAILLHHYLLLVASILYIGIHLLFFCFQKGYIQ